MKLSRLLQYVRAKSLRVAVGDHRIVESRLPVARQQNEWLIRQRPRRNPVAHGERMPLRQGDEKWLAPDHLDGKRWVAHRHPRETDIQPISLKRVNLLQGRHLAQRHVYIAV